jgi:hypothetical protein
MTSLLSVFDRALFQYLCGFIQLEDNFARVLPLCKSVNDIFSIDTCCKNDIFYVMQIQDHEHSSEYLARMFFERLEFAVKMQMQHVDLSW